MPILHARLYHRVSLQCKRGSHFLKDETGRDVREEMMVPFSGAWTVRSQPAAWVHLLRRCVICLEFDHPISRDGEATPNGIVGQLATGLAGQGRQPSHAGRPGNNAAADLNRAERLVFLSDGRVFFSVAVITLAGSHLQPAPVQLLQTGQAYNPERAAANHECAVRFLVSLC